MKFCVDIDAVLRDMLTPMIEIYNSDFNENLTLEDVKDYDVDVSFPQIALHSDMCAYDYFFSFHSSEIVRHAPAIENAAEALDLLRSHGHEVIIVSYQPTLNMKIQTLHWLAEHGMHYDKIVFTDTPSKKSISNHCDYIIDDRPEYLEESTAIQVCIDYPYNRYKSYNGGRWNNIYEYANIITSVKEGEYCS